MPQTYSIDRSEVLRYLGYAGQEISPELSEMIDRCMQQTQAAATPRVCWKLFDCAPAPNGVAVAGTTLVLPGADITRHLKGAQKVALMAATLGTAFDSLLRTKEAVSMTEALILDSCGSEYIEKVCDAAQQEILRECPLPATTRFSPGYGDLPIAIQPAFLQVLDTARKIGLSCTPTHTMIPRKSVTAIIGFAEHPASPVRPCDICSLRGNCALRKRGKTCGKYR